jgi:hypothetical protein
MKIPPFKHLEGEIYNAFQISATTIAAPKRLTVEENYEKNPKF